MPHSTIDPREEREVHRHQGTFFAFLGLALVLAAVVVLLLPWIKNRQNMSFLVVVVLLGAIVQTGLGFFRYRWSGLFASLLNGNLYAAVAVMTLTDQHQSPSFLVLLLASFYLMVGVFQVSSVLARPVPRWKAAVMRGAAYVVAAVLLRYEWPATGLNAVCLFVGVDMLWNGLGWMWWGQAGDVRHTAPTPGGLYHTGLPTREPQPSSSHVVP